MCILLCVGEEVLALSSLLAIGWLATSNYHLVILNPFILAYSQIIYGDFFAVL